MSQVQLIIFISHLPLRLRDNRDNLDKPGLSQAVTGTHPEAKLFVGTGERGEACRTEAKDRYFGILEF